MRFTFLPLIMLLVGCSSQTPGATQKPIEASPVAKAVDTNSVDSLINSDGKIDAGLPDTAAWGAKLPKAGDDVAILDTVEGRIVVKFFPTKAPNHAKNFIDLAIKGFYNGTKFHRVIPGFMIQGGDPNTKDDKMQAKWGQGGPEKSVDAEFNDVPHTRGILSMARSQDVNSAGSQFFIMHADHHDLDGKYTVFGQVIEGMNVVDKIVMQPSEAPNRPIKPMTVIKVEIKKWPIELKGVAKAK